MSGEDSKKLAYPRHHWGALAEDPWMEMSSTAAGEASRRAALRAWLAGGGSQEVFEALCEPTEVRLARPASIQDALDEASSRRLR